MIKHGVLFALLGLLWIPLPFAGQECSTTLSPPSGHVFSVGDALCFESDAAPETDIVLENPNGAGGQRTTSLYSPFLPGLDNGACLPRSFLVWDQPQQFVVRYSDPIDGCFADFAYSLETSGEQPPQGIAATEVSFRKKGSHYFIRVLCEALAEDPSCVTLALNSVHLPITRYETSAGATTIEGLIGNEAAFVRLANGPPSLTLEDTCTGKVFQSPPIPPGKEVMVSASVVYDASTHQVSRLGLSFIPWTGCEVTFYSWRSPVSQSWKYRNLPTYLPYGAALGGLARLPPSFRHIWKRGGLLVFRQYDYCTGEFVGALYSTGGS